MREQPLPPEELVYLWSYYLRINGPERLTFAEIKAFSELNHLELTHWEVEILIAIDRTCWGLNGH